MDSQFVSILIGIGFVVGLPLLEKLVDKIKQGKHRSVTSAPPRRQTQSRSRTVRPEGHNRPTDMPAPAIVEGARVTSDTQYSPYGSTPKPQRETDTEPMSDVITGHTNLKDAVVWSEILNNPKFKEF